MAVGKGLCPRTIQVLGGHLSSGWECVVEVFIRSSWQATLPQFPQDENSFQIRNSQSGEAWIQKASGFSSLCGCHHRPLPHTPALPHTPHPPYTYKLEIIYNFQGAVKLYCICTEPTIFHDDVIKWKHFPRNWPFVRGIHRSPVTSPHKGQWRGVLMFSLICAWINDWVNNREAGDLRHHRAHYDVIVMSLKKSQSHWAHLGL